MKKVKYLLGCFILGFLVSITNGFLVNSVIQNPFFELSSFESNSNSAVIKSNGSSWGAYCNLQAGTCNGGAGLDQFAIYNGEGINYFYYNTGNGQIYNSFPEGLLSFNGYVSNNPDYQNVSQFLNYSSNYMFLVSGTTGVNIFSFLVGNGPNFGKLFFGGIGLTRYLQGNSFTLGPAVFNIGGFFNTTGNYSLFQSRDLANHLDSFYRFFYTGSLDGYNLINPSSGTNQGKFWSWERLDNSTTLTNFGSIIEKFNIHKYTHFSLYSMGYSFIYKKSNSDIGNISWNDLQFATVSDSVEVPLKLLSANQSLNLSSTSGILFDGILVLPEYTFHSGKNDGQFLLSKDPNNPSKILYEYYSCSDSDLNNVFAGLNDCYKVDGGYLSFNGNTNVLPFSNFNSSLNLSNFVETFPFLKLLTGHSGSSFHSVYSYVIKGNNELIFRNNSVTEITFGLESSAGVNLKSMYYNGGTSNSTPDIINSGLVQTCLNAINDSDFEMYSSYLCDTLLSNLGNPVQIPGTDNQYISVRVGDNGELYFTITSQDDLIEQMSGYVWEQDENGNWYTYCPTCNINNLTGSDYLQSGALSTGYYDFSNTGLFFKCPYPYNSVFTILDWDLNLGKFDIAGPINCFISAFNHGKTFTFLTNVGLYDFGPLIQGNTSQHNILYRFLDVVICLGLLLGLGFIFRIFK